MGISVEVRIVPGAAPQVAVVRDLLPGLAGAHRAEERAVVIHDQRRGAIRPRRRDRHADLAEDALRQPPIARDLYPGVPTLGGLEECAPLSAADELVRIALHLPH